MIAICRNSFAALVILALLHPGIAIGRDSLPGLAEVKRQAMIFFIAQGRPNSCGQGCSTWIAAEGAFDPEAHIRLRRFLDSHPDQDLPIYFHSMGGMTRSSVEVGKILRQRRMTAGIGQTIPDGCRGTLKANDDCRRVMGSSGELKARLRFDGVPCASACVYAFIGATTRSVPPATRLGVHASRSILTSGSKRGVSKREHAARVQAALTSEYARLRLYVVEMGVSSDLIETARLIPPQRMHWLSRDDIAQFGIAAKPSATPGLPVQRAPNSSAESTASPSTAIRNEAAVFGETQWSFSQGALATINKWMMRPSTSSRGELRVTSINITCHSAESALLSVRRELVPEEYSGVSSTVRILSSGNTIWLSEDLDRASDDMRTRTVAMESLKQAALDGMEIEEVFSLQDRQRPSWTRKAPLSPDGLAQALDRLVPLCRD